MFVLLSVVFFFKKVSFPLKNKEIVKSEYLYVGP